jgi:hypothetical protein
MLFIVIILVLFESVLLYNRIIIYLLHTFHEAIAPPPHFTPVLLVLTVNNMDGCDRIINERMESDSSEVCNDAVAYYGLASREHCRILGVLNKHALNAHIWPAHDKSNLLLVDLQPSITTTRRISSVFAVVWSAALITNS